MDTHRVKFPFNSPQIQRFQTQMPPRHARVGRLGFGSDLHGPCMVVLVVMLLGSMVLHHRHHGHLLRHGPLAVNHGLNLVLRHARCQQALAHLAAQLGFGLLLLLLLLGGLLDLLDVPALHSFFVGLFACCHRGFGSLLLFELGEVVLFDNAIALGFFFLGLMNCEGGSAV